MKTAKKKKLWGAEILQIWVGADIKQKLAEAAAKMDRDTSWYIRNLISRDLGVECRPPKRPAASARQA